MPPAHRPWISALDALECPYPDCIWMFVRWWNLQRYLGISHQGQPPPPTSHQQNQPPYRRLYSTHRQSPTATPEPNSGILVPSLDAFPVDTDSGDDSHNRPIPQPHCLAQSSNSEDAEHRVTPMDKENPEIKVPPTAGRTFGDDSYYIEFWNHINILWQLLNCAGDFKQAIRFVKAHYPTSQIDHDYNEDGCKIPEHFSYTSGWMIYNEINTMHNLLPKLREATISTPNDRRFFYFRYPAECEWYLTQQHPANDQLVFGPTRTIEVEGDRVYSMMNSADWW